MTPKDKRDYIELLLNAIVKHDDFFYDAGGAVCWEAETNRVICCTPAWEYLEDPSLELPDDGDIGITFDWVEDDRDESVSAPFYTNYDNIESDVADYMRILKSWVNAITKGYLK